jgi:hypothetical protein
MLKYVKNILMTTQHLHTNVIFVLIGGLEHFILFHILGISRSHLTFIFFRGVGIPPTGIGCVDEHPFSSYSLAFNTPSFEPAI